MGTVIGSAERFVLSSLFLSGDSPSFCFWGIIPGGIFITRGLHLDGLADSFDALFLVLRRIGGKKKFLKDPVMALLSGGDLFLSGCQEFFFWEE